MTKDKRELLIKLEFYYPTPTSTQPMMEIEWGEASKSAIRLMQSSDYVYVRSILENKKMNHELKEMLYEFCNTFARKYEKENTI